MDRIEETKKAIKSLKEAMQNARTRAEVCRFLELIAMEEENLKKLQK